MMGNKNGREIRFSSKLDISKYCSYSKMDNNYELYAILVHAGFTVNSGHYYSYCRTSKGTWSRYFLIKLINDESLIN
jgi:ubiquitin carboxyl-terminal hydrolase 36/42